MIRVTCPSCGSKLNAKDELAGHTRKCPKCAQPVLIVADAPAVTTGVGVEQTPANARIQPDAEEPLLSLHLLDRLHREYHYLVCDKEHLLATWENNGQGWMLKTHTGLVNAKRNSDKLPNQGDFRLVELKFTQTPDGKRLSGLTTYQLASHWALIALAQGDDPIVEKVANYGTLNRDQKNAVRQALRDQFMRPVWENADDVLEYLGNVDYHSHSVGATI
jgi:hypothetical protein